MEKREYNVYKFNELPEDAQQKALENLYDINVDHDWWGGIYDDAKNIGLEITSFNIDRGSYCKGNWLESPYQVIKLIKENHGKNCETYKTAIEYEEIFSHYQIDENGDVIEDENLEDDFRNSLLEDYRIMLQHEYDYLTSKEAVIETINCNDYDFTLDGKID